MNIGNKSWVLAFIAAVLVIFFVVPFVSADECTPREYNECTGSCHESRHVRQNADCSYDVLGTQFDSACSAGCAPSPPAPSCTPREYNECFSCLESRHVRQNADCSYDVLGTQFDSACGAWCGPSPSPSPGPSPPPAPSPTPSPPPSPAPAPSVPLVASVSGPGSGKVGDSLTYNAQVSGAPVASSSNYLIQALIHVDGRRSWYRKCAMSTSSYNGVDWRSCSGWNFVDLAGESANPSDPRYSSLDAYEYVGSDGRSYLAQSLIHVDGRRGWYRSCAMDSTKNIGVDWPSCTDWRFVDVSAEAADPVDSRYGGLSSYTFTGSDGRSYLAQSLIHINGRRSWYRKCNMDASGNLGVDWSSCSGWNFVDLGRESANPSDPRFGALDSYSFTSSQSGGLKSGEIWVSTSSGVNYPYGCPGRVTGEWCNIATVPISGSSGSFSASWTPQNPGSYYVVVNAYENDGRKCSGNPFGLPSGWADCGPNDRVAVTVASSAPTASITGPARGVVGSQLNYSAQVNGFNINKGEVWVSTSSGVNYPYGCPGRVTGEWCNIGSSALSGNSGSVSASWTPRDADTYYVVVNGYDSFGNRCSGNPFGLPSGWADCGPNDALSVQVSSPPVNHAPVLSPVGDRVVVEGGRLEFVVSGSDVDGDVLSFSASGLPVGAVFDRSTRSFSWSPGFDQSGSYSVSFAVSDGVLSDSETISIVVGDVNRAPVLNPVGDRVVDEGMLLSFVVSGSDPDNDIMVFSAANLPRGAVFDSVSIVCLLL
ncbi:hypothetical protein HYY72_02605 [Candidatus Woesearchaeota archaeon]|nr:hypothetical protein [Candidatus Woesearchaeota archaeon]